MSNEPTTVEKLRGLPWSVACNAANAVFSQFVFFGSVFVLFLNTLGMSKTAIGFVLALIPFSAVLAPVAAPVAARYGYKRVFLVFYGLRKIVTALLLVTPWVQVQWGASATLLFVAGVVALFAVARSLEETAYIPWVQEFVPNSVRGKYSAASNIFTALVGFIAVWVAGAVLAVYQGLPGFLLLFAAGVIFGLISVWAASKIPGGAPQPEAAEAKRHLRDALADADFRRYGLGVALITLGTAPLAAFLPLFMQEQVGLRDSDVVLLQMGTLLGALLSSYLWGWAADRYGSKPVMLVGALALALTPVLWWLTPGAGDFRLYAALTVAFVQGVANLGWGIGAGRLLYVRLVPADKRLDYMAVYFAWAGVVAGLSQLLGGRALDLAQGISGTAWGIELNPYAPLFGAALALPLLSVLILRRTQGDSPISTSEFAAIFLRGNPLLAMGSMIRFYRAKDEHDAVLVTERMGEIGSRLTVDELLDALADPRFNVRFEAILAMARMPPDPRITAALVQVLQGRSPALSVAAAWALGRIGDRRAIEPLRGELHSPYRSVRAYTARALGTIGDAESAPELLARLVVEEDEDLGVAYASAVGKLGVQEAARPLLDRLRRCPDDAMRMELALALARLVGNERRYVNLARGLRAEPGTTCAQTVTAVRRHLARAHPPAVEVCKPLAVVEEDFAREQMDKAAAALGQWLETLPAGWHTPVACEILGDAALILQQHGAQRREYLLLALHTLTVGLAAS